MYIGPRSSFPEINPVTQWIGDWALSPPAITNLRIRTIGQGKYWGHTDRNQVAFSYASLGWQSLSWPLGSTQVPRSLQDLLGEVETTYWFPSSSKLLPIFQLYSPSFNCIELLDSLELQLMSKLNSALTELKNQQGNVRFLFWVRLSTVLPSIT